MAHSAAVVRPAGHGHTGDRARSPRRRRAASTASCSARARRCARCASSSSRVADTDVTVLIRGESGTGKELVARAVHTASPRRDRTFVKVNCAALPSELLESELFGFERGAFTGAIQHKPGKFEFANHGTMFLDEISEMARAAAVQAAAGPAGRRSSPGSAAGRTSASTCGSSPRPTAISRQAVADGQFREDLFFRLNVVCITLPPLRQRRDEIPALTRALPRALLRALQQAAARAGDRHAAAVRRVRVAGERARAREPRQAHGHSRHRHSIRREVADAIAGRTSARRSDSGRSSTPRAGRGAAPPRPPPAARRPPAAPRRRFPDR